MRTIWKFPLSITDTQTIHVPEDGWPIAVAEQRGTLVMWVEMDPESPLHDLEVRIVGTGGPLPDHGEQMYVGSVVMSYGLVWHVYVVPQQKEKNP